MSFVRVKYMGLTISRVTVTEGTDCELPLGYGMRLGIVDLAGHKIRAIPIRPSFFDDDNKLRLIYHLYTFRFSANFNLLCKS